MRRSLKQYQANNPGKKSRKYTKKTQTPKEETPEAETPKEETPEAEDEN